MNPNLLLAKATVLVVLGGSSLMAVLQTSTPAVDVSIISQMERLGLIGVLIAAVGILWRKLESKDIASNKMVEALTANANALASSAEDLSNLRDCIGELKESIDHLITVRETLASVGKQPRV